MESAVAHLAVLSPVQQQLLEAHAVQFLEAGDRRFTEEHRFDLGLLQRYIAT